MKEERKDLEHELSRLSKRLEELEEKLKDESGALNEALQEIRFLRNISTLSAYVLRSASYITRYQYGDISRHIVEALMQAGPMNISQLTKFLRGIRGQASRRIISERIKLLHQHEIVEEISGKKSEKRYRIKDKNQEKEN